MHLVIWALVVSCLWAIAPIVHKTVFKLGLHPKSMMAFGGFAYFTVLCVWAAFNWKDIRPDVKCLADWRVVALIGFSAVFTALLSTLIYYRLINEHPAHLVTAITYSSPLFTLILAWWLLKEQITPLGAAGVFLIVLGVLLISSMHV
jgi:drug/metabolite transporter (DMT)-like permease